MLISVQERGKDAVKVGASANEQQHHEQQRLELEDAELASCLLS